MKICLFSKLLNLQRWCISTWFLRKKALSSHCPSILLGYSYNLSIQKHLFCLYYIFSAHLEHDNIIYIVISVWASLVAHINAGNLGSILGLGRSPREGDGYPLHYSCEENPCLREGMLKRVK